MTSLIMKTITVLPLLELNSKQGKRIFDMIETLFQEVEVNEYEVLCVKKILDMCELAAQCMQGATLALILVGVRKQPINIGQS